MRATIRTYNGTTDGVRWGDVLFSGSDVGGRMYRWDRLAGTVTLYKALRDYELPDEDPERLAATMRALEGRP